MKSRLEIIALKTYCKNVDITDRGLVSEAVYDCLHGKYKRHDVLMLLSKHSKNLFTKRQIAEQIKVGGTASVNWIVELIIDDVIEQLKRKELKIKPIWYSKKYDTSCHKEREIGIQDISQQLFDYVAVYAMRPILKRIGQHQCASVPNRGQRYGIAILERYVKDESLKYVLKCDIRRCFPSIRHDKILPWLKTRIKNHDLNWLLETLVNTFREGLSIGSYLSQYLCNLYLSELYHHISEKAFKVENGKRVPLVRGVVFYMDDIAFFGESAEDLHVACDELKSKAESLGLEVKPEWRVWRLDDEAFVDMMGVRVYRSHVTIRRSVYKKIRRAYKRANDSLRKSNSVSVPLARKCVSYWGKVRHTDSTNFIKQNKLGKIIFTSKRIISNYEKINL